MDHEKLITRVDSIAMATGIVAGLAAAGSALATPTGLTAFGVWLGLIDEPLIVTLAPILDNLATVAGTLSGFTYFVARWQQRKLARRGDSLPPQTTDQS